MTHEEIMKKLEADHQEKMSQIKQKADEANAMIILDDFDKEKYKEAIKSIRKAIKNLREGNGDAVFDRERCGHNQDYDQNELSKIADRLEEYVDDIEGLPKAEDLDSAFGK